MPIVTNHGRGVFLQKGNVRTVAEVSEIENANVSAMFLSMCLASLYLQL